MRSLLLAALSFVALTDARDADACGGYRPEPEVFQLSSHTIVGRGEPRTRVFALLPWDRVPTGGLDWQQLAPRSFDATQVASGKPFARSLTLTLLGPAGTRVVSTTRHVFLARSWRHEAPVGAAELAVAGDFELALHGTHAGARWIALDDIAMTPQLSALVASHAGGVVESMYAHRVKGSDAVIVSFYARAHARRMTLLVVGDKSHGTFHGSAIGAFANDGAIKLVLADGARTSQVDLAASL